VIGEHIAGGSVIPGRMFGIMVRLLPNVRESEKSYDIGRECVRSLRTLYDAGLLGENMRSYNYVNCSIHMILNHVVYKIRQSDFTKLVL